MNPGLEPRAAAIIDFWFGPAPAVSRPEWFKADATFDQKIVSEFGDDYAQARAGECDSWQRTAPGALALVVVLDQFPRNMFRGSARAFESDAPARVVADMAIAAGFDRAVSPTQRIFFYLPFEHAEDVEMQDRSLRLITALAQEGFPRFADYAERHAAIIRRFGRFPHRNALLGRHSTPEEQAYLKENPAPFG